MFICLMIFLGPVEQVRIFGTLSPSAGSRPQTAAGEMVEGGQAGMFWRIGRLG